MVKYLFKRVKCGDKGGIPQKLYSRLQNVGGSPAFGSGLHESVNAINSRVQEPLEEEFLKNYDPSNLPGK